MHVSEKFLFILMLKIYHENYDDTNKLFMIFND